MGGLGSRFQTEGYRFPKPLINIVGRPMLFFLLDRLKLEPEDKLFVALSQGIEDEFHVGAQIKKEYPQLDLHVVILKFQTRGAAETLFVILQSVSFNHIRTLGVSNFYLDGFCTFRASESSCCFYFEDRGNKPVFSYLEMDEDNVVHAVKEKVPISTHANTGAYGFSSGNALLSSCVRVLDVGVDTSGEYYISSVITQMLSEGLKFIGIFVEDFSCIGTPWQLKEFLSKVTHNPSLITKKRRFCFDLDDTLVTSPVIAGDYSTVEPKWRNIRLVQQLHSAGAVMADVALVTFDNMKKFGIPYDEVYFGKPWADVYVDDKAVHAMLDTEKEIGWSFADEGNSRTRTAIAARSCNNVQIRGDTVIKTSNSNKIVGEVYFYEHIPKEIKHLFPRIIESLKNEATSTYTITMDKIEGVTFSHLATSRCLTKGRFIKLLEALRFIHSSQAHLEGDEKLTEMKTACIYANGASKVRARLHQHKALYEQLDSDVHLTVNGILNSLDAYEQADAGVRAAVVHGDPVFSNVLLEKGGEIRLIDMRGMLGDVASMCGDALYDIAKVFQSLCGYDFVLLDLPMASKDVEILAELKEILRSFVRDLLKVGHTAQFRIYQI
ncbi:unnamed protein product [Didymodactylos carnosus]|uniref:Nucleotidyl transferase domain-containing protein n=1 Tax=Didymodactylos carnosus TaxID=1234261 RepID=A0A814WXJ1_9BILA|nr:unnamed protein product [Didymodactylos carnosus]CAF3972497.1 unnamed protein product [Didymodactylos carnosus]